MWDLILSVFLMAHVLAGLIAVLIAFPVAALAMKGSNLHRWAGLTFVGCFFFICIGGYLLEFENLKGTVVNVFGFELEVSPFVKKSNMLAVVNTAMVNTCALYLAVSGWRVWARARAADRGVFPKFDSIIAALEIVAGLLFAVTLWRVVGQSVTEAASSTLSGFLELELGHLIIIAATLYVMGDAGHDLYSGLARKPPKSWWVMHARKLITAEMGLAAAFPYRCMPFGTTAGIMMLVAMIIVLVFGVAIIRRFSLRSKSGSAPA